MAKKKTTPAPGSIQTNIYMRREMKAKLEAIAAAQRRGSGRVVEDAIESYLKTLPPEERKVIDFFLSKP